jgi:hypothetical protein
MAQIDDLLEAERRGILPQDLLSDLQEARKRGLAPAALAAGAPVQPQPPAASQAAPAPKQAEMSARDPTLSERLADATGMSPRYWSRVVETVKAPIRFMQGAEEPYQGLEQGLAHGSAYVASAGRSAPNMVSRALGSMASSLDETLRRREEERQTERQAAGEDPGSIDWARTTGNVGSPLNYTTARALAPAQDANLISRL